MAPFLSALLRWVMAARLWFCWTLKDSQECIFDQKLQLVSRYGHMFVLSVKVPFHSSNATDFFLFNCASSQLSQGHFDAILLLEMLFTFEFSLIIALTTTYICWNSIPVRPGIFLSALYELTQWIINMSLWGQCYSDPHFADGKLRHRGVN